VGGAGRDARRRRQLRARRLGVGALAVVTVVALGSLRAASETIPAVSSRVLVARRVAVGGRRAVPAWPSAGEAALATWDGKLIASSGPTTAVPIGSVTKVMTAYLTLTEHPLRLGEPGPSFSITASEAAHLPARVAEGESLIDVYAGETFDEYQALRALLIPSADNIAAALARFDAGSRSAFVARMNSTAARLGMTRTHFVDPSGLDAGSVSDPADLVRLASVAMRLPVFAQIVDEATATIPGVGTVTNYNSLVGTHGFVGIKTGSTPQAGGCLLFAVVRTVDGHRVRVLGAVLGQRGTSIIADSLDASRRLVDSWYSTLLDTVLIPAGTPVLSLRRAGAVTRLVTESPLRVLASPGSPVSLRLVPSRGDPARARPGAAVSARLVAQTETGVVSVPVGGHAPPPPSLGWRLGHLFG
jgi:D-alanyl-D-alanine carboxypeptidase (penicillin-binding protein 5/6)